MKFATITLVIVVAVLLGTGIIVTNLVRSHKVVICGLLEWSYSLKVCNVENLFC